MVNPTDNQYLPVFQWATAILTALGVVLNLFVMNGLFYSKNKRTLPDFALNFNLVSSDFLVCLTWCLTQLYCLFNGVSLAQSKTMCQITGFSLYLFLALSVFTLIAIAVFHYRSIVWEKGLEKPRHVVYCMVFLWVICICGTLFSSGLVADTRFVAQPSHLYCLNEFTSRVLTVRLFNFGICFTLFTTPIILGTLYYLIWKKLHSFRLYFANDDGSQVFSVNVMLTRRAIALSLSFACLYYFQTAAFTFANVTGEAVPFLFDAIGATVVSTVSVINPILFLFLDIKCRNVVLDLFRSTPSSSTVGYGSQSYNSGSDHSKNSLNRLELSKEGESILDRLSHEENERISNPSVHDYLSTRRSAEQSLPRSPKPVNTRPSKAYARPNVHENYPRNETVYTSMARVRNNPDAEPRHYARRPNVLENNNRNETVHMSLARPRNSQETDPIRNARKGSLQIQRQSPNEYWPGN